MGALEIGEDLDGDKRKRCRDLWIYTYRTRLGDCCLRSAML